MDDFNIEKNKKALSEKQMASLDRWERFEKSFPFYRIDVNGFIQLIDDARRNDVPNFEVPLHEIPYVTLESLHKVF